LDSNPYKNESTNFTILWQADLSKNNKSADFCSKQIQNQVGLGSADFSFLQTLF